MERSIIAITGSSGFIGINIVINAMKRGWNIKPIVRNIEAAEKIKKLGLNAEIVKDFNINAYRTIFNDCTSVIHLIAKRGGNKESYNQINLGSLKAVTEASAESGMKRIIFVSGLGVHEYGNKSWATNDYFKSKMMCERYLQSQDLPFVIFRPSYIIGSGDSLIRHLYKSIHRKSVFIADEGETPMQPIYIKDATDAILSAATGKGPNNSFYDLVGPEIVNRNDLVNRTAEIMKKINKNIPAFQVVHIDSKDAQFKLGYSKVQVDISLCDTIGDFNLVSKVFELNLTPINVAIEESLRSISQ